MATFILALKTAVIARKTDAVAEKTQLTAEVALREAEAVERQIEISADGLRASVQPWLVWVPTLELKADVGPLAIWEGGLRYPGEYSGVELREEDGEVVGHLLVSNVGSGIAIIDIEASRLVDCRSNELPDYVTPTTDSPVIPPRGTALLRIKIPPSAGSGSPSNSARSPDTDLKYLRWPLMGQRVNGPCTPSATT